jgi:pimeloyl-ACP methyl ester carboxylesterase
VPVEKTTLMGQSLGSGVAAEMARRGLGARLVLLSPYTSIPEVAARVVPILPGRLLVRDRFATAEKAPEIRVPTLIVHGEKDELIPVAMGRELGRRFPQVTVEVIAEAHHNDLFAPPHGAELVARIAAFAR